MESLIAFLTSQYVVHLAILVCIYLILAQSYNIVFGLGRLFNLAHISCYAIGSYTTALLATEQGASFSTCVIASMLLAGLFSLLLGGISLRLERDYFAIGTLAFSFLVTAVLINWRELTRGVLGIPGIPRPDLGIADFQDNVNFLLLVFPVAVLVQVLLWFLTHGRYGRSLRAQAESDLVVQALGKRSILLRNSSFLISSSLAGLAGAFFAYYLSYIDPSSFSFVEIVFVLTIVVVGRPGSMWGCIVATVFLVLLPEPLRFIKIPISFDPLVWDYIPSSVLGPVRQLLHSFILFGVVWWNRAIIFPVERKI